MPDGIVDTRFIFLRTNKLLKNLPVFFCCCGNGWAASFTTLCRPSLLDFFDQVMNCHAGTLKTPMLLPDFAYEFQPFSLKSFSMTVFGLSVKAILLRYSELGNCETSERRLTTSTNFDLHCNGFLHCHDFFSRQRRKKTN